MHYTELGYKEYGDYLNGMEWKQLHDYFYEYCGEYKCRICGNNRWLILHKRTYDHLTLKSLKRRFWFIRPFIVNWLKNNFVWLCRKHNGEVHFYDNGSRVPLNYTALWKREQEIYKKYNSWWRKVLSVFNSFTW